MSGRLDEKLVTTHIPSGIIVPKAMPKVTFISETYEAISVVFFLRLLMVYMGGILYFLYCLYTDLTKQSSLYLITDRVSPLSVQQNLKTLHHFCRVF